MHSIKMENQRKILCVSNSYKQKYYFNELFQALPREVKEELKILCVLYTEEVGGILSLEYEEDGTLILVSKCDEGDLLYDEIGSILKIKQLQRERSELFESLELFYKVMFLHQSPVE